MNGYDICMNRMFLKLTPLIIISIIKYKYVHLEVMYIENENKNVFNRLVLLCPLSCVRRCAYYVYASNGGAFVRSLPRSPN